MLVTAVIYEWNQFDPAMCGEVEECWDLWPDVDAMNACREQKAVDFIDGLVNFVRGELVSLQSANGVQAGDGAIPLGNTYRSVDIAFQNSQISNWQGLIEAATAWDYRTSRPNTKVVGNGNFARFWDYRLGSGPNSEVVGCQDVSFEPNSWIGPKSCTLSDLEESAVVSYLGDNAFEYGPNCYGSSSSSSSSSSGCVDLCETYQRDFYNDIACQFDGGCTLCKRRAKYAVFLNGRRGGTPEADTTSYNHLGMSTVHPRYDAGGTNSGLCSSCTRATGLPDYTFWRHVWASNDAEFLKQFP